MKSIKSKSGVVIKIYSSASECEMIRYKELQKYLILESCIGDSFSSLEQRLLKLKALIEEGKNRDAILETENAIRGILSVKNGVSYTSMAFACLVAEIGGQVAKDISYEGLQVLSEQIEGLQLTFEELSSALDEVKKK